MCVGVSIFVCVSACCECIGPRGVEIDHENIILDHEKYHPRYSHLWIKAESSILREALIRVCVKLYVPVCVCVFVCVCVCAVPD